MHPVSSPVSRKISFPFFHPSTAPRSPAMRHRTSFPVPVPRSEPTSAIPFRHSPVSWEDSLQNLSKNLQMICGSPPQTSPTTPQSLSPIRPDPQQLRAARHSTSVPPTPRQIIGLKRGPLRRSESVFGPMSTQQSITVRHIETPEKLKNKLSEICGSKLEEEMDDVPETAIQLKRPVIDASALRLKFSVAPHTVENIVVVICEPSHLSVETISGKLLYRTAIKESTRRNNLVCYLAEDCSLYIREKTSEVVEVSYTGTGNAFVPIVKEDESRLEFIASLHVPEEFRIQDINVKTVDDDVIVTGIKRRISTPMQSPTPWTPHVFSPFDQGSEVLTAAEGVRSFRLQLRLPPNTDTRSVHAYLTNLNQLIIKAKLGKSHTRRLTF